MHVERETVRSWILIRVSKVSYSTIFRSNWESNTASKDFIQDVSIRKHDSILTIDVVLSAWDFLTESEFLLIDIVDLNGIRLISTGPNHEVSFFDMLALKLRCFCFDKADSLFFPTGDIKV